jgi:hypothetical protein
MPETQLTPAQESLIETCVNAVRTYVCTLSKEHEEHYTVPTIKEVLVLNMLFNSDAFQTNFIKHFSDAAPFNSPEFKAIVDALPFSNP